MQKGANERKRAHPRRSCKRQKQSGLGTPNTANDYPRNLFFSDLIRRGVIYYAGNLLPLIIVLELIMRGNSVSHYVDRLFWGLNYSEKSSGN